MTIKDKKMTKEELYKIAEAIHKNKDIHSYKSRETARRIALDIIEEYPESYDTFLVACGFSPSVYGYERE